MAVIEGFPPLQGAISQAESWTRYLNAQQDDLGNRRSEELTASLENIVWIGVHQGELLPFTWCLTFHHIFGSGKKSWSTVKEFEAVRQEIRRLFFTARAALDLFRQVAETLQSLTGQQPAGMDRLLKALDGARELEETVFRAWPSFAEPLPASVDSLLVDEALAEALGITVEEARQKMDSRRSELGAKRE